MRLLVSKHTAPVEKVNKLLAFSNHRIVLLTEGTAKLPDSAGGLEYTDTPGHVQMLINANSPNAKPSTYMIPLSDIAQLWDNEHDKKLLVIKHHNRNTTENKSAEQRGEKGKYPLSVTSGDVSMKRIKIGFISSDYGVHPIATLIRGLIQFIDPTLVELYCFAINDKVN